MINLQPFLTQSLFDAGTDLFRQLGIELNSNTTTPIDLKQVLGTHYKEHFNQVEDVRFLGLVDDKALSRNGETISYRQAGEKLKPDYPGLVVFAVRLADDYSAKKNDFAELARAFNRSSASAPVVVLAMHGSRLSFVACERTEYKQKGREGEKVGRISLLRNIDPDPETTHRGHIKILEQLKTSATTFDSLYREWQEVFNVSLLNKSFYREVFHWYLWAKRLVKFPKPADDPVDEDTHASVSVIRLLTRIIFCWFIKEKGLITDELFDEDKLREALKKFDPESNEHTLLLQL